MLGPNTIPESVMHPLVSQGPTGCCVSLIIYNIITYRHPLFISKSAPGSLRPHLHSEVTINARMQAIIIIMLHISVRTSWFTAQRLCQYASWCKPSCVVAIYILVQVVVLYSHTTIINYGWPVKSGDHNRVRFHCGGQPIWELINVATVRESCLNLCHS